jgi:hypothetical protein
VADLIDDAQAYVVRIDHENGCASGVLLGNSGLVLTNYHVIRGANSLAATTVDGTWFALEVLTYDIEGDLALLQATWPLPALATIPLNTDVDLRLGESIFVLGYPFPSSQSPNSCGESITVTRGILAGRINVLGQELLQTDAALNPGVSGGLALTSTGVIAGMAVSGPTSDVTESVGFLIPVSAIVERLTEWLPRLAAGTLAPPPLLGQIAFTSDRDGDSNIYVMDTDGGGVQQLTDDPASDRYPAWSPDGTRIAFVSIRDGDSNIYVMDADGGNVRQITDRLGGKWSPTWSPDSTLIAFGSNRDGDEDIYVMDADGGNVQQLTDDPGVDRDPAWSPDGTRIAFVSTRDGDSNIYVMDVDGGNVRQLTDDPRQDQSPAWSPDGTRIAFASHLNKLNAGGADIGVHIYVMDADGGNVRQLTDAPGSDINPAWSPDGTWITFEGYRDDDSDIYVMDAYGGRVRQLRGTRGHRDYPAGDYDPTWLPGP